MALELSIPEAAVARDAAAAISKITNAPIDVCVVIWIDRESRAGFASYGPTLSDAMKGIDCIDETQVVCGNVAHVYADETCAAIVRSIEANANEAAAAHA